MSQQTFVVTGGAGFIGSHLVELLLREGHVVRVIDNYSTGSPANLAHLENEPGLTVIEGSVTDSALVARILSGVDGVFHLAASVGVKYIMDHLVASIENNMVGTATVLEVAARERIRVLLTSTSEVYGKSVERPSREDDDLRMGTTLNNRWSYACSKALDEYLAFAYWRERQLPVTVVRLFNTVGERQSAAYGMVLPTFVQQALDEVPLTIHGDGRQSRSFCNVSDIVGALWALMQHPAAIGEVFNLGSSESVTIEELADRVIAETRSTSSKVFTPYEQAYRPGFEDTFNRLPDISKAQQLIGFRPRLTLDDIIRSVVVSSQTKIPHRAEAHS